MAALFRLSHHPVWRSLHFARLCVARGLGWCDHDYRRWGGHTSESIATYSVLGAPASIMGSELPWLQGSGLYTVRGRAFWVPLLSAAFALLQRRVGDESNPPVAPSVAESKQKSAYVETCCKGTATDGNNA